MKLGVKRDSGNSGVFLLLLFAMTSRTLAADGVWANAAGGDWSTNSNWEKKREANGKDNLAIFSISGTEGAIVVNLDVNRTIGSLSFGNASTSGEDWVLWSAKQRTLTLSSTGNEAVSEITVVNRTATIDVRIASADADPVKKLGFGTLVLSGANTFGGFMHIEEGVLRIEDAGALGATNAGTRVNSGASLEVLGGIATVAEKLILNGSGVWSNGALRNLGGDNEYAGYVSLESDSRINSDSGTLMLTGALRTDFEIAFGGAGEVVKNGTFVTGSGGIVKDGAGSLSLNVFSSYAGGTSVLGGSLYANAGSATGNGEVFVDGGARLGGYGSIAPSGSKGISVSGVLTPGHEVGSIDNLTLDLSGTSGIAVLNTGALLEFDLGVSGASFAAYGVSDLLTISTSKAGALSFNNNTIDFRQTGSVGFYKLIDTISENVHTWSGLTYDAATGEITSGLKVSNLGNGLDGTLIIGLGSNGGAMGDIYLNVIPEPGCAAYGGVVGLMLLCRHRRHGL